mgnify:CR=1 FL=1
MADRDASTAAAAAGIGTSPCAVKQDTTGVQHDMNTCIGIMGLGECGRNGRVRTTYFMTRRPGIGMMGLGEVDAMGEDNVCHDEATRNRYDGTRRGGRNG